MPGLARGQQSSPAASYHVRNRGHNREVVFADDQDHADFLDLLARYRQRFPVRPYHYCLMSNHFYLLVHGERLADLSAWMAGLLRAYGKRGECPSMSLNRISL
jgi:putative transposase